MKPLYKHKRFWALMALLGVAILVVVLIALRRKKDGGMPVTRLVPPTTTVRTESTDTSDGVVFKPLSLDMIKDSPSMAMMFLLEKIYSDENPCTPLPSKQLLREYFPFEYKQQTCHFEFDPIWKISLKIINFLLEERDLEELVDELRNESKPAMRVLAHFGFPKFSFEDNNSRHPLTSFIDLTVFDPKIEAEKLDAYYSTLLELIRIVSRNYEFLCIGNSRLELEFFVTSNTEKIFEVVRLFSQKKLLSEMCGVNFDDLSLNKFQLLFIDFIYMPRAGPWIVNNMRLISIYQATKVFAPLTKKHQLFSKSDIEKMADIKLDNLKSFPKITFNDESTILSPLYKHLKIDPNGYFYYFLSKSLKEVEFPQIVDFNIGSFGFPIRKCSLTQANYPSFLFEKELYIIQDLLNSEDEALKEEKWKIFNFYPFKFSEFIYNYGFAFDPSDLDRINHRFSLEELSELRDAYSTFPIPLFTEAQKQKFTEIYSDGKFLLDQTKYKPDFEELHSLKNWPLFLLVTDLIILLNVRASVQLFVDANLNIADYKNGLESCPAETINNLNGIWSNFANFDFLSTIFLYHDYSEDKEAYCAKYAKVIKIYNDIKSYLSL